MIFLVSFLVVITILGSFYYYIDKTHDKIVDKGHDIFVAENPDYKPPKAKGETVINTLFLGVNEGLSDIMMVIRYNTSNHKLAVISVPRDTKVLLPSKNEGSFYPGKINAALSKDPAVAMKIVGELLEIPIHHYLTVNLKGAEKVVDILGGVQINVKQKMDYEDPTQNLYIHLNPGVQVLNGEKAVHFVRYRSGYANQDLGRIGAQQDFMRAFFDKLTGPSVLPKALSLVNTMSKYVKTNLSQSEIASYAKDINVIKLNDISINTVPGVPRMIDRVAYFIHDPEKLSQIMQEMETAIEIGDSLASVAQSDATNSHKPVSESINKKDIKVEILNSTGKNGLAGSLRTDLQALGYNVVKIGDTKDLTFITSRMIDRCGIEDKVNAIANDANINIIDSDVDNSNGCDVTIILGKDRVK